MKHKRYMYIGFSLIFAVLTFACSLFSSLPMDPVPEPLPVEAPPQPVPEAVAEPVTTTAILPIGIATDNAKSEALTIFDRDGYTLLEINTPGLTNSTPDNLPFSGAFGSGSSAFPVVYYSFEQNTSFLLNNNQQVTTLFSAPYFAGMTGAPGLDVIAYTTADFDNDPNALRTQLFVGTSSTLASISPAMTEDDPQGWSIVALAVGVVNGRPVGVWYSKRPWGIGGDIVFEPRRSLFYLDLATGSTSQILGAEANPSALSTDQSWIAYTDDAVNGFGPISIRNLQSGANVTFSLLPVAEPRGAGTATFSPNAQYLAWMEGSGWQMGEPPSFHSTVRVGDLSGNIVAEFADTALVTVSGLGQVSRVEPVGWFDDSTLVIMARGALWDQAALIRVDIPSQTTSFLANGVFLGFIYP
ncbi:MAG: hypothetical protein L3J16_00925 [Anaerolineales bacterium]|nr:hypothetical protein [Anaerolineales bacterium]